MKKIVVIEDEDILRKDLHEMLTLEGYLVSTAANGLEGIEMVRTGLPDLIVCDIRMPGMDGYQVLKAIRELPGGVDVLFIFLTAKVEREDIRTGMNLGADDYLLKPFTRKELMGAVQSRLSHRQSLRDNIRMKTESLLSDQLSYSLDEVKGIVNQLSKTEKKVFYFVSQEKSTSEIATLLYVSPKTVENHRHNISKKLNLKGGHSVMALALKTKPVLQQLMNF